MPLAFPQHLVSIGTVLSPIRSVLFVSDQNTCRSIAAEGVFRYITRITELGVGCDSAGMHALFKTPPDPDLCSVAALRGYDFSQLRSRVFRSGDFVDFDLILAIDQDNLSQMKAQIHEDMKVQVKSLMDYSRAFTEKEILLTDCQRGRAIVLDYVEDACLGLYHHLTNK